MTVRIACPHCKGKTKVTNSNDLSDGLKDVFVKDLYVQCLGKCGARSVVTMYFKHYLHPPEQDVVAMAREVLRQQEQLKINEV